MDIKQLANKYNSQKKDYVYMLDAYQKHLPKECNDLLEIGCLKGGFTRALNEFYNYKAKIQIVDLFHPLYTLSIDEAQKEGYIPHQGKQADLFFISKIETQFDLIVEDGSHHSDDQIITWKYLFENNLKSGGLYVLEDLHCCVEPYWWNEIKTFEDTFLSLIKKFNKGGSLQSQLFTKKEADKFADIIDKVYLYSDSIAFFYKK